MRLGWHSTVARGCSAAQAVVYRDAKAMFRYRSHRNRALHRIELVQIPKEIRRRLIQITTGREVQIKRTRAKPQRHFTGGKIARCQPHAGVWCVMGLQLPRRGQGICGVSLGQRTAKGGLNILSRQPTGAQQHRGIPRQPEDGGFHTNPTGTIVKDRGDFASEACADMGGGWSG